MANALEELADRLAAVPPGGAADDRRLGEDRAPVASAHADARSSAGGGWPVEPADAFLLDRQASLGVCTLGDPGLAADVAAYGPPGVAAVGPLATENIGLEKLVRNVLALPALTRLLVVGPETGGTAPTGHYAGDALLMLLQEGWNEVDGRIRGARGQRPFLRNLAAGEVAAFRSRVEVVDRRGTTERDDVDALVGALVSAPVDGDAPAARSSGRAAVVDSFPVLPDAVAERDGGGFPAGPGAEVPAVTAWRWRADPAGYVLVFVDHARGRIVAEHYRTDDRRTVVIVGEDPRLVAVTLLDRGLVSRLDHAAYLGRELERAARALAEGRPYVQDAAPGQ